MNKEYVKSEALNKIRESETYNAVKKEEQTKQYEKQYEKNLISFLGEISRFKREHPDMKVIVTSGSDSNDPDKQPLHEFTAKATHDVLKTVEMLKLALKK